MAEITEIRCSACGSNDATKISVGKYECNHCETKFDVKSEFIEDKIKRDDQRLKAIDEKEIKSTRSIKRTLIIIGTLFLSFFGFIFYMCFSDPNSQWNDRTIVEYKCFWSNNDPVIFKLYEQTHNTLDSVRYFVKTVNPITDQLQDEMQIGKVIHKSNSVAFLNAIDLNFSVVNNVGYVFSKDSGFVGYSIYSFNQVLTSNALKNKFPQLKNGITEAVFYPDSLAFKIGTSDGKKYFYYPEDSSLVESFKSEPGNTNSVKLKTDLFLTLGKNPQLFKMEYDEEVIENNLRVTEDKVKGFSKHKKESESEYGIYNVANLESKLFYKGKVLGRYKGGLLILYSQEASNTSKITLELVDTNGKIMWQNSDDLLQNLKNQSSNDELYCDYFIFEDNLAISSIVPKHETIGLDLKTGKIVWLYPKSK